jgi:hypothetical protein
MSLDVYSHVMPPDEVGEEKLLPLLANEGGVNMTTTEQSTFSPFGARPHESIEGRITLTEDECNLIYYVVGDALDAWVKAESDERLAGELPQMSSAIYEGLRARIGANWDELAAG